MQRLKYSECFLFKEELHNNVTDYKKICQTDYNFIIF